MLFFLVFPQYKVVYINCFVLCDIVVALLTNLSNYFGDYKVMITDGKDGRSYESQVVELSF